MNVDGANGFRPVRPKDGSIRMEGRTIASAYNTGIFMGDPVKSAAGGGGIIELAAAGDTLLGIFAGCEFDDEAGRPKFLNYWPANQVASNIRCSVYTDNGIRFLVQSTTAAAANIGDLVNHGAGTGNPKTGNSGAELDGTTYGTGTTFKVVALSPSPDNEYGNFAKLEVIIVTSEL